uniref:Uncharacterized protein n=1 Tax=Knipowitschia caucasica TaxID=637954 RepID=A0AAV2JE62_KNICA
MHYSKWLIDIKNRAALRNPRNTPGNSESSSGDSVEDEPGDCNHCQCHGIKPELTKHLWNEAKGAGRAVWSFGFLRRSARRAMACSVTKATGS